LNLLGAVISEFKIERLETDEFIKYKTESIDLKLKLRQKQYVFKECLRMSEMLLPKITGNFSVLSIFHDILCVPVLAAKQIKLFGRTPF